MEDFQKQNSQPTNIQSTNVEPSPEVAESVSLNNIKTKEITIASAVLIVAALIGVLYLTGVLGDGYFGFSSVDRDRLAKNEQKGIDFVTTDSFSPTGTIYLTLVPTDGSVLSKVYTYDIDSSSSLNEIELDGGEIVTSKLSKDGKKIVFAKNIEENSPMQVFSGNTDGKLFNRVSNNQTQFKREPVWSNDEKSIAYVAYDASFGDSHLPESWRVYVTDMSGDEILVTEGYNPIFAPNDRNLLVLKNDGLYIYDLLERKSPVKVWSVEGDAEENSNVKYVASSHMKLSLSNDKKTLAWSNHHEGEKGVIAFFDILSWEPFSMKAKKKLNLRVTYSVFSPDDRYVAFQASDLVANGIAVADPRIMVYGFEDSHLENVLELDGFNLDYQWLTDWR